MKFLDKLIKNLEDKQDYYKLNFENVNFNDSLIINQEILLYTNLILQLPTNSTEMDGIRINYMTENWILKKFIHILVKDEMGSFIKLMKKLLALL